MWSIWDLVLERYAKSFRRYKQWAQEKGFWFRGIKRAYGLTLGNNRICAHSFAWLQVVLSPLNLVSSHDSLAMETVGVEYASTLSKSQRCSNASYLCSCLTLGSQLHPLRLNAANWLFRFGFYFICSVFITCWVLSHI